MEIGKYFASIRDFRVQGRCLPELGDILGLVLCGTLADCDDFSEIEDYGQDNIAFLKESFGFAFPNGISSEDTLDRVVRHLDSQSLAACFQECLTELCLQGKLISIDGKELRGTLPSGKKHALVQMVNVWVQDFGVSFGQLQIGEKSNEITAIPTLLDTGECG